METMMVLEDGTATDSEDGNVGGRTSVASGETVSD